MIPPWLIHIVTVAVMGVGFGLGYWFRGWKDRVDLAEALHREKR